MASFGKRCLEQPLKCQFHMSSIFSLFFCENSQISTLMNFSVSFQLDRYKMETVKFGRTKIKVRDFISVPHYYFGDVYLQLIKDAGIHDDHIYDHVTFVIDGNRNFTVK